MEYDRMSKRLGRGLTAIPPKPILSTSESNAMADLKNPKTSLSTKKGKTRGKNPRDIEYQAFDLEKPDLLPANLSDFMEVTGVKEQADILSYVIDGFNSAQYSAASDEIGEFINDAWDKDTQGQFRLAVRNYSKLTGMSIDDSVALIKPGVEKAWAAKAEKAKVEAEKAKTEETTAAA
jgi:hypothetical protein